MAETPTHTPLPWTVSSGCDHDPIEALKVMRSYGCPVCNGDCGSANPPVMFCPMQMIDATITKAEAGQ